MVLQRVRPDWVTNNLCFHQHCTRSLFSLRVHQHLFFCPFYNRHCNVYEVVSHCVSDVHFPNHSWHWASFHVTTSHTYMYSKEQQQLYTPLCIFKTPIYVCLYNIKTNENNYKMEQRKKLGIFLNYKVFKLPKKPYTVVSKWTTIRCKYIVQTPAQLH